MTVAKYTRPNYSTQSGTDYPANIDAMAAVFERLAGAFAPHEQTAGSPAPDLTVVVDAGAILDVSGAVPDLNESAQQTVSGFTVPSAGLTRVDRVVLHEVTGLAVRVAGTAVTTGGSPSAAAPDILPGYLPCCRVTITSADTAITNDMIVDERQSFPIGRGVPAGAMFDFAGTAAPPGYLGCDGAAVSRLTYSALFGAIGTAWGVGDGLTTFNVPNFQRRVAVGSGGSGTGTLGNAVGNTGGAETHTLTTPEIPAHSHAISSLDAVATAGGGTNAGSGAATTTGNTGGGGAHNNMQPSAVVLKIIKT